MKKKKLLKTCLPLMLACSLLFGSTAAVTADSGTVSVSDVKNPDEGSETPDAKDRVFSETENDTELKTDTEKETDTAKENSDGSRDNSENAGDSVIPGDSGTEGNLTEITEDSEITENPEDTPYRELLSEDNLIIVTVDQNSSVSEEMQVETVEELSEQEITALEEYIEDQGYAVTKDAMLAAASSSQVKTITFNMNGFISLAAEGYGTGYDAMFYVKSGYYQGNGNAYCIDPSKQAPGHNSQGQQISYTTTVNDYTDPMLLKIMYYGFGGVGDITAAHASSGPARHILTHMVATRRAAELGIPGAGDYTYGANSTAIAKANALYADIQSRENIQGVASVLTPVAGQQTIMLLASYALIPRRTSIRLKKVSANPGISDNNPAYSLEGAVYGVYSDSALKNNVGTLETQADGNSTSSLSLNAGTYYVKELTAPKGFQLDDTVYTVTGKAGETVTVRTTDIPAMDPVRLLLQKVDGKTGESSERLKGAQFTVKYYATASLDAGLTPNRSWVFATDEKGEIYLADDYKVSGDSFYTDTEGTPVLPLGLITIQESLAPEGYLLNDTLYSCSIQKESDGSVKTTNLPTGENAVKEMPETTELSVSKIVSGSGGNKNTEFHFELILTSDSGIPLPSAINCSIHQQDQQEMEMTIHREIPSGEASSEEDTAVYAFTLQHGQEITFKELPVGLNYKVEEKDGLGLGYTVKAENEEGTLTESSVHASFLNTKEMIIPTGANSNTHSMTGILITAVLALLVFLCLKTGKTGRSR